jgi:plastocyanin
MQYRSVVRVAAVVALAAVAGACGSGGGVGGGLNKVKGGGGTNALGQATTTAPPTTAAPVVTTAPKAAPTTTRPEQPAAVYTIQSDTKGQYIDPLSHSVTAGSLVRFTNSDTIGHQISGKLNGATVFTTPLIAPGASADVRATVRGTLDIVDEQRTYAQGVTLTVS